MNKENLKAVAPNVQYEIEMLDWSYQKVMHQSEKWQMSSCYVECFLLHARNLVDFYVKPMGAKPDDVFARLFFIDQTKWEATENQICSLIKSERSMINKKLAHLTYARIDKQCWDVCGIYSELQHAKSIFMGLLDSEKRAWFKLLNK